MDWTQQGRHACHARAVTRLRSELATLQAKHDALVAESEFYNRSPVTFSKLDPADIHQLEACADLVLRLHQHGPTVSNRNRVELLGYWVEARNAERAKAGR